MSTITGCRAPALGILPKHAFHVFELHGTRLLFDVVTSQVVEIDELMFRFLSMAEQGDAPLVTLAELAATVSDEEFTSVMADLDVLREQLGFFQVEHDRSADAADTFVGHLQGHHPRNMMLLVTRTCNLKCTYCYEVNHNWHVRNGHMTVPDVRRAIDEFMAASAGRENVGLTFFGGEPLANFAVVEEAVAYSLELGKQLEKNVSFSITTNGTLLTPPIMDFLVEHAFAVLVSLDGDKETNDRYRKDVAGQGTHDRVVANLKQFLEKQKAAGVRLARIRATLTRENDDAAAAGEYLASLGAHNVMLGETSEAESVSSVADIPRSDQEATEARNAVEDTLLLKLLEDAVAGRPWPKWVSHARVLAEIHSSIWEDSASTTLQPKLCGIGRNMRAVTPEGNVYPCHRFVGMEAYKLRDGFDGTAKSEREASGNLYRAAFDVYMQHCSGCWVRHRCGGLCSWYLAGNDGELAGPKPQQCVAIRRSWERSLWLYYSMASQAPEFLARMTKAPPEELTTCSLSEEGV